MASEETSVLQDEPRSPLAKQSVDIKSEFPLTDQRAKDIGKVSEGDLFKRRRHAVRESQVKSDSFSTREEIRRNRTCTWGTWGYRARGVHPFFPFRYSQPVQADLHYGEMIPMLPGMCSRATLAPLGRIPLWLGRTEEASDLGDLTDPTPRRGIESLTFFPPVFDNDHPAVKMYVVTSATSKTGSAAVHRLLALQLPVRPLSVTLQSRALSPCRNWAHKSYRETTRTSRVSSVLSEVPRSFLS
jgi:hypothetical protein